MRRIVKRLKARHLRLRENVARIPRPKEVAIKLKAEAKAIKHAVADRTITLVISAFGLVAALAWNEAIKVFLANFFKQEAGIVSLFVYALSVTVLAVVITSYLSGIIARTELKK